MNERLQAALRRAGAWERSTFYSPRHSAATTMLAADGTAKTAADRLGNHSAGFTLDRYLHALESLDAGAAGRLQHVLATARKRVS